MLVRRVFELSLMPLFNDYFAQPLFTVLLSETLVDWLKHAFITKFNHIRPSVYERYTDVLCRDLASASATGRRGARKVGSALETFDCCQLILHSIHMPTNHHWLQGDWVLLRCLLRFWPYSSGDSLTTCSCQCILNRRGTWLRFQPSGLS